MRFHAILRGVETERPVEWHSQEKATAESWARLVLKKYRTGRVEIYERKAELVETVENAENGTNEAG